MPLNYVNRTLLPRIVFYRLRNIYHFFLSTILLLRYIFKALVGNVCFIISVPVSKCQGGTAWHYMDVLFKSFLSIILLKDESVLKSYSV